MKRLVLASLGLRRLGLASSAAVQLQLAALHVAELVAVELAQVANQPLVDRVSEQEHLDAPLAEDLQVRARPRGIETVGREVPDDLLVGRLPAAWRPM